MAKIGINNFRLPERKPSKVNSGLLLPQDKLEMLQSVASPKVVAMTLRAVGRAELYDSRHPFWNAIANSYIRVIDRIETVRETYPDIVRVIHNDEVIRGDILVSDFHIGLNFGYLYGGNEPAKICALDNDGDTLTGRVLRQGCEEKSETGYFKNEIWFFISHRFTVLPGKKLGKGRVTS